MSLDVFEGLQLPDDFVTQPAAILARRGAGKTYAALKIVEQLVEANQPVVVLDPLGVCYGLRSSPDGKKPGLPVTILGGDHGDLPIEPTSGKVVANFVVDHPGAYVLDLSSFTSNAQQDRFAEDFAVTLYRAKGRDRTPLHLVVDEADSFAPQKPMPDQRTMLGAFEAIVRRGRSRGLGVTLVSQRPAVLNKNVLTQIEVLVALQVTSPQDRDALKLWAEGYSTKEQLGEFLSSLATLKVGQAWVWSPQWLAVFTLTLVMRRSTFDSSSTPKAGETRVEPRVLAPVDLDVLKADMADVVEKQDRDDPKRLHGVVRDRDRTIRDLERKLAARASETVEVEKVVEREVPVLGDEAVEEIEHIGIMLAEVASQLETQSGLLSDTKYALGQVERSAKPVLDAALDGIRKGAEQIAAFGVPSVVAEKTRAPRGARVRDPETGRAAVPVDETYRPRSGARRMLVALATYPDGLTTAQVATLAKVKRTGGTFGTYASEMIRAGLVVLVSGSIKSGVLAATTAGIETVGGSPLPSDPEELRSEWRSRLKARGAKSMFDVLVGCYPEWLHKQALAEHEDVDLTFDGGTFGTYLSRLRSNGLIEEDAELVRAHPDLFLDGS
jgi:hypothetical protein